MENIYQYINNIYMPTKAKLRDTIFSVMKRTLYPPYCNNTIINEITECLRMYVDICNHKPTNISEFNDMNNSFSSLTNRLNTLVDELYKLIPVYMINNQKVSYSFDADLENIDIIIDIINKEWDTCVIPSIVNHINSYKKEFCDHITKDKLNITSIVYINLSKTGTEYLGGIILRINDDDANTVLVTVNKNNEINVHQATYAK